MLNVNYIEAETWILAWMEEQAQTDPAMAQALEDFKKNKSPRTYASFGTFVHQAFERSQAYERKTS